MLQLTAMKSADHAKETTPLRKKAKKQQQQQKKKERKPRNLG